MAFQSCQQWTESAATSLLSTLKEWHCSDIWGCWNRKCLKTAEIHSQRFCLYCLLWCLLFSFFQILKMNIIVYKYFCMVQHLCMHFEYLTWSTCTKICAGQIVCINCVLASTMWVFFVCFNAVLLMPWLPGACYHLSSGQGLSVRKSDTVLLCPLKYFEQGGNTKWGLILVSIKLKCPWEEF